MFDIHKWNPALFCSQVIKNLLFVAKVIYLISPESDTTESQEQGEEEEEQNGNEEEGKAEEMERPPSLLWVMKKLSMLAKREAADAPKVPLKVIYTPMQRGIVDCFILIHMVTAAHSSCWESDFCSDEGFCILSVVFNHSLSEDVCV